MVVVVVCTTNPMMDKKWWGIGTVAFVAKNYRCFLYYLPIVVPHSALACIPVAATSGTSYLLRLVRFRPGIDPQAVTKTTKNPATAVVSHFPLLHRCRRRYTRWAAVATIRILSLGSCPTREKSYNRPKNFRNIGNNNNFYGIYSIPFPDDDKIKKNNPQQQHSLLGGCVSLFHYN